MKIKASDLIGPALDWAVSKCEEHAILGVVGNFGALLIRKDGISHYFNPSSNWEWGGPIIEREGLLLKRQGNVWLAYTHNQGTWASGPRLLIAAMRCYVASKLGNVVEIPEEVMRCKNTT